jgi:hypothetical protein
MSRLRDWLARYGPPEALGTLTALASSFLTFHLTHNDVAAAYGGAIGENLGFYGLIVVRQILRDCATARASDAYYGRRGAAATMARLLAEFGPAEAVDTLIVRPFAMGVATHHLGRGAGVLIGKLVADVTFYLPVIASYELQRWVARRRRKPGD